MNEDFENDPSGRPNDGHIHTPVDQDRNQVGKAYRGVNSLHYGRHLDLHADGFRDCGGAEAGINPSRRGPGFTENGETRDGVWVHSKFNLARYAGRHAQIRWIISTVDDVGNFFISYLEVIAG